MNELTHFDEHGASRMVDVSQKDVTMRMARASGRVRDPSRIEKAEARLRALGLQKEARHAAQD